MPHWDAIITMHSPPIVKSCGGDPLAIHDALMEAAPQGANVRAISFEAGRDVARIRVEGPKAEAFLKELEATEVVQLLNAHERAGGTS